MADIFDMVDTWDDVGTTFTAIKMDVTDTASASGSLLLDLLVGGTSQFSVEKDGSVTIPAGAVMDLNGIVLDGNSGQGVVLRGNDFFGIARGQAAPSASQATVRLYSDDNDTFDQRRGANAQTFNIYNTFTDASNYERGGFKWDTNVLEVFAEAAGTGTQRDVVLNGANRATKISDPSGGSTVDSEARTAINSIIDALEAHGISATS